MMDKFKKLHINLDNIGELNHYVHSYALKENTVGLEYSTIHFHSEESGSTNSPWKYQINKHGYRGNNWSFNKDAMAFFGCSITFGIGVEKDIATVVQEFLKTECYNIGQPGASAINVLKTFSNFIQYHPIKTAIITLPAADRIYRPHFNDRSLSWSYENLILHWISPEQKEIHSHAYKFFSSDTNLAYLYDYIKSAELTAKMFDTDIVWSSWDSHTIDFLKSIVSSNNIMNVGNLKLDKARDDLHPGPLFVQDWSLKIVEKLRESFSKNL